MPRSSRLVITGDRDSPIGKHFTNAVLIARHRPGKSPSPCGKTIGHAYAHTDNPGVDAEGGAEGPTGAHPANRVAQYIDLRHQQIRTGVAQVHRKEEGSARNPIAAITRHTRSMPDLSKRRNALPFSALRLL